MDLVERIGRLFAERGQQPYAGARREAVSATQHALQCGQLAEWADADAPLVAAAFLHDVGHLLAPDAIARDDAADDRHEERGAVWLVDEFGLAVSEPVRLHVQAKRYLARTDPRYAAALSPASVHSLALQGGPMREDELVAFEALPFAREATMLRRWDDLAKEPSRGTPPLEWYLSLLQDLRRGAQATRNPAT